MGNIRVPLTEIIQEYKDERQEMSDVNEPLYMRLALQALRDLSYSGFSKAKYVQKEVNSNLTVDIPDDSVKIIDVFAQYGNQFYPLVYKKNIRFQKNDCGDAQLQQAGTVGNSYYSGIGNTFPQHFKNGESIGARYGIGGRSYFGEYTINEEDDRIELLTTGTSFSVLVIEYLPSVSDDDGEYYAPEFCREAIKNYIDWKLNQRRRGVSVGEKDYLKTEYYSAKHEAKKQKFTFSVNKIAQLFTQSYMLAPKGH